MRKSTVSDRQSEPTSNFIPRSTVSPRWFRLCLCLAALIAVAPACDYGQQQPPTGTKSILLPAVNRPPDANAQMEMRDQQSKKQGVDAANAERKKQLNEDSLRLLKLASDLKLEVDKTSKDTLSLSVIRKADEIERLAHTVKEKMKLTMAAN